MTFNIECDSIFYGTVAKRFKAMDCKPITHQFKSDSFLQNKFMAYKITKATDKYLKILSYLDDSGPSHIHNISDGTNMSRYNIGNAIRVLQLNGRIKVADKRLISPNEGVKTYRYGLSVKQMNIYDITVSGKDFLRQIRKAVENETVVYSNGISN